FNSALVNVYRNGFDSNGWHADDEKELGPNPIIGSVSFGSTRTFVLKHNTTKKTLRIPLCDGDVLWMGPSIQVEWKHCIPKQPKTTDPRINVTFRTLYE
ncbi:MAG: alpha-ketoglutarate-dependent dioxygenase AlkB family protein, partial [Flavobacteriales bacterium]